MGVDSKHPLWREQEPNWEQMRDTYKGERRVKDQGTRYLPPTSGMLQDGMERPEQKGFKAYDAYRKRSRFPEVVRDAVEALLGVMHRKPPKIELPESMEFLREKATARNESLELLLRRVNEEQLVTGRVGLLGDVNEATNEPYLAFYEGPDVINWDEGRSDGIEVQNLNFVAIDETEFERLKDFEWEEQQKYRILTLGDPNMPVDDPEVAEDGGSSEPVQNVPQGQGTYRVGVFRDNQASFNVDRQVEPSINGRTLDEIPFVFINTKDIIAEPDDPPLLGLSSLALAIYRGEADYRQALFMQGQDTLVVIGGGDEDEYRTGAGAVINVPSGQGNDAKFIGVDSSGLSEMRESLQNDYDRAGKKGGQLLDNQQGAKESGEALRVRVAAKTTTLVQIAQAGAAGLQRILRIIGKWLGLSEAQIETIVVLPNLDFADDQLSGAALTEYMSAKMLGAPMSLRSIHMVMQDRGLTEFSFEDEVREIAAEEGLGIRPAMSTDEDGPEDDEEEQNDESEEETEEETEEVGAGA